MFLINSTNTSSGTDGLHSASFAANYPQCSDEIAEQKLKDKSIRSVR